MPIMDIKILQWSKNNTRYIIIKGTTLNMVALFMLLAAVNVYLKWCPSSLLILTKLYVHCSILL